MSLRRGEESNLSAPIRERLLVYDLDFSIQRTNQNNPIGRSKTILELKVSGISVSWNRLVGRLLVPWNWPPLPPFAVPRFSCCGEGF